MNLWHTAHQ
ncbi:Protein of unknown function [Bacillus cytotoxicus]|uniref:Uncharacterized protein n=1 Tax=Bacillus cytotoxicus TaxID=580165 RepID=A0AAX2CGA0_9BACI|nr:Protein of unknown function [Bacillus cytotoxicus]SCN35829.1 Protein of unknown function [Bacillus cytotoxicus]